LLEDSSEDSASDVSYCHSAPSAPFCAAAASRNSGSTGCFVDVEAVAGSAAGVDDKVTSGSFVGESIEQSRGGVGVSGLRRSRCSLGLDDSFGRSGGSSSSGLLSWEVGRLLFRSRVFERRVAEEKEPKPGMPAAGEAGVLLADGSTCVIWGISARALAAEGRHFCLSRRAERQSSDMES
ncbi:hypothetical protein KCV03_g144, partial [Aureobasidium melanogenum]